MIHPRNEHFGHWTLDPEVVFLNHGSFGATPREILELQNALRGAMEKNPMRFLGREYQQRIDSARDALATLIGADPRRLVFVDNATSGVNAVLRSFPFQKGDEILVTDHGYGACNNAARFVAERIGGRVVTTAIPFPVESPARVVEAIVSALTPRTRLAVIDHVTSPTALAFPIADIVAALAERGVETIVDGAHALGMLPLRLDEMGAAYYTANAHKWLCAPKGAAILHARDDRWPELRPLTISHGATEPPDARPRGHHEFDWTGTRDPSAWMCAAACVPFLDGLMDGGIASLMERNHRFAVEGRRVLLAALGTETPCPEEMLGSMASVFLPDEIKPAADPSLPVDPLQLELSERHGIEVPVMPWKGRRLIRISTHAYNTIEDVERLAEALAG